MLKVVYILYPGGPPHRRQWAGEAGDRRVALVRLACFFAIGLLFFPATTARAEGGPGATFERDGLPLLKARCYSCHDTRKQRASYRLDVRSRAIRGGESGRRAIVPGKPGESELYRRITSDDDETRMPPSGQ